jgi:dolichol-phosphate mannosyltransferase
MLVSVIIPCYNEEKNILETYNRLNNALCNNNDNSIELLFINDGSKDSTQNILQSIAEKDKKVKIISFSRNFGHQAAVVAGIKNCTGDVAAIIDADLQDPPELIPDMIKALQEQSCNVVYGVRKKREGESFFKLFTAKLFYRLLNTLSEVSIPNDTGDFRIIDKKVINAFNQLKETNKYIRGLISWIGYKQVPFYYNRDPRIHGETKYTLRKMLKFASIGVFYFSKKPLKIALNMGILAILIGLSLSVWIVFNRIFHPEFIVTGWTSIILIVIFFGGIQLLTIGVLGQYIGSLFDEAKGRPEYIIDTKINFENK